MRFHAVPTVAVLIVLIVAGAAQAATFIVPSDEEMVAKSHAILVGTVEGSFVQETKNEIETVYEIRADRGFKGVIQPGELVRVVSPGGVIADRGVLVPGAARYRQGERVLVFLTMNDERWQTTDLTLGKFRFVTSTRGERLLVRDMEDVVGWDASGGVHREIVRREEGFLRFVAERAKGRPAARDYEVDASEVTLSTEAERFSVSSNATSYPARTYTDFVNNQPIRWPNMSAGVTFFKRSDQNISGASDGGVSAIQSGLAAWTNECGSLINLIYGGQIAKASANHDATNVVEYNDPQQRISGSWGGSGTVAVTFLSFAGEHTFLNEAWLNITDADVVFQDGFPATNPAFPAAMTHELGHGIGWRHSNQDYATGGTCNSSVEECTSAAIMNSSVSGNYGYTLQPWDVNAAQSVYPGGSCGTPPPTCTPPSIIAQPGSATINSGGSVTLTVTASGTTPLSYQWYVGSSGNTSTPVSGGTGSSLTVGPSATTSYWVRITNSCGSVNSATATVTVNVSSPPPPPPSARKVKSDFNADGKSDLVLQNTSTAGITVWLMNGTRPAASAQIGAPSGWVPVATGDLDGDGRADVIIRRTATGEISAYLMAADGLSARTLAALGNAGTSYQVITTADFNRDGTDDIVFQHATGAVAVWLMRAGAVSSGVHVSNPGSAWYVVGSGDVDADGWPDLVLQNYSTAQIALWKMQGTQITRQGVLANSPGAWRVIAVGDVNGDSRDDLILRHPSTGSVAVWTLNGFTFLEGHVVASPGTGWTVNGRGDYNGDGTSDIVLQNTSTKNVAVWLLSGGKMVGSGQQTVPSTAYKLMLHR